MFREANRATIRAETELAAQIQTQTGCARSEALRMAARLIFRDEKVKFRSKPNPDPI